MDTFRKLVKSGRIGRWCKFAARVIAVIGIVQITANLYLAWAYYQNVMQTIHGAPGVSVVSYLLPTLLSMVNTLFQNVGATIFYCVALYVAGTIFGALATSDAHGNDDDIIYENIDADKTPV